MIYAASIFYEAWQLLLESSPYMILGLLFSGILRAFIASGHAAELVPKWLEITGALLLLIISKTGILGHIIHIYKKEAGKMTKTKIIITVCLLLVCLFQVPSYASDFELTIKEVTRISEKEVVIKYSVISKKNFDFPNVSIAFKIIANDKPIGCKEVISEIPEGSDGSDIQETTISTSSGDKEFTLNSRIFYSTKRYRIEEWFADCESH